MTSIGLPIPLVLLLRRLLNAFSAFSLSQTYLASRWNLISGSEGHDGDIESDVEKLISPEPEEKEQYSSDQPKSSWNLLKSIKDIAWSRKFSYDSLFVKPLDIHKHSRLLHTKAEIGSTQQESLIHQLLSHPTLFDPVRVPRYPIVLCHGLYGFDVRGPETFPKLRMHYWSNVLHILRKKVGAEVVVTGVPGTGSIASRAERMDQFLRQQANGREINFLAHSMGGLDCRHLLTHIKPREYVPLSLTSLSVPHRGSPFMDWCSANIGIGSPRPFPIPSLKRSSSSPPPDASRSSPKSLPYSLKSPLFTRRTGSPDDKASTEFNISMLPSTFTDMVLSLIDSPAYSNLTTSFLRDTFNPFTPNVADIKYFSVAARTTKMSVWNPLWLPKFIIDAAEEQQAVSVTQATPCQADATISYSSVGIETTNLERNIERGNDGLVTVSSAKWGEFLGTVEGCDHWEMRGAGSWGVEWNEGWGKSWRDWVGTWKESDRRSAEASHTTDVGMTKDWATRNDLTSHFDLERFYVALSRKLYDEGL